MLAFLHDLGRWLHLCSGFSAVGLGAAVMLVPKFGRWSHWHRRLGRVYAVLIAGSCLLGVPLAYARGSAYLMVLGTFTFAVVAQGWADGRAARAAAARGDTETAGRRLRWHLILMGASYIGAWSGFFATNPVFGADEWSVRAYVFGPSVVGAPFIARAALRLRLPRGTANPTDARPS
jgi:uncharacterized membrane protein